MREALAETDGGRRSLETSPKCGKRWRRRTAAAQPGPLAQMREALAETVGGAATRTPRPDVVAFEVAKQDPETNPTVTPGTDNENFFLVYVLLVWCC